MKTVQMTLDEALVADVDKVAKKLKTTRSEFTRRALAYALRQVETIELERRHRESYKANPVKKGEFNFGETEQGWPDWSE